MTFDRVGVARALLVAAWLACGVRAEAQDIFEEPRRTATETESQETSDAERARRIEIPRGPVVAGPVDPDQYLVGPGDVFELVLSGRLARRERLIVGPDGTVIIPGSGALKVYGLTLTAARERVQRAMGGEFRGVRLDLHLIQVRMMRVHLTGDVKRPGPVEVAATSRASDVLPPADLETTASQRNVLLYRRDGSTAVADLQLFLLTGRTALNPYLQDGDVVHVPRASRFIEVHGAVANPERLELGPADSLSTALALAGGPLPSAQRERAMMVRWRTPTEIETTWFDVDQALSGASNPVLRDGDRVYLFHTAGFHALEQASILGEVTSPGVYPLRTGQTRLSDLVTAAGGFLPRADLTTIRVYRNTPTSTEADAEFERLSRLSRSEMTNSEYEVLRTKLVGRREDFRVDWRRLRESPELDLILRDRDVVRIDPLIASVRVEGEVRRPGIVQYDSRRRIQDYVELAGGYSERAARGKIRITRSVTGQTLRASDVRDVAPGDLIWVPERADVPVWQHLATLVGVAAQVATLVIAIRR